MISNAFLLSLLGGVSGLTPGSVTNTSVYVTFSGPPGFVIVKGFTVSDGSFQYIVQDGGIIGASGVSLQLFCIAVQSGFWAVPAGTVTQE